MHSLSMIVVYYMHWSLVFLICLTKVLVEGQKIKLTSRSLGYPDYYINDTLTWNCTTSGYTGIAAQRFSVDGVKSTGCTLSADGWGSFRVEKLNLPALDYCEINGNSAGFTILANHKITPDVKGLQIGCQKEEDLVAEFSNTLTISTSLKVAPQDLTLKFANPDQPIAEDKEFQFECSSTSASNSNYVYYLKRRNGAVKQLSGSFYTPDLADRNGFVVQCEDIANQHWKGGNTHKGSDIIYPAYIDLVEKENRRNVTLNLINPEPIICDVIGNPPPTFSWARQSRPFRGNDSAQLLSGDTILVGDKETVTCTAKVAGIASEINISWKITWIDVSTSTAISTRSDQENNCPIPRYINPWIVIIFGVFRLLDLMCILSEILAMKDQ